MSETLHSSPQHVRFVPWIPGFVSCPCHSACLHYRALRVRNPLWSLSWLAWRSSAVITDSAEELEVQVTEAAKKQWMELPLMVAFNVTIPGSALKTRTSGEKRLGVEWEHE